MQYGTLCARRHQYINYQRIMCTSMYTTCPCFQAATANILSVVTNHATGKSVSHDDVIKWKHFPRYWPFVKGRETTGHRWILLTKPVTWSFDVFFDLRLNKRLSKRSRRRWFETPSRSIWRHCNVTSDMLFIKLDVAVWIWSNGNKSYVNSTV